eukprot:CAMPEP_0184500832 /NCGR_PEP_ID=MMETSP0113_2-20130426/45950_1 /TAXON_ID=91329 /ORGANISM="Norrisiella sphaerica, Strain BC52" /LENGTH=522 /DNA_ID=CAMNT_0026889371 /DNA_START=43 /DNA_END=1611 /DNA_ORIENTATION=-
MAFVSRQKREFDINVGCSTELVSPASYVTNPERKIRGTLAPFSTSSMRGVHSIPYQFTPGPGEYNKPDTATMGKITGAGTAFKSRSKRNSLIRNKNIPGPGQYSLQTKDWVRLPANRSPMFGGGRAEPPLKDNNSPLQWVRVATAPSIPAREQKYGYKVDTRGELVPKKSPERKQTYFREQKLETLTNGSPWSHSKTKRGIFNPRHGPGPGHYSGEVIREATDPYPLGGKGFSSLASATKRFQNPETPGPGPAAYDKVRAAEKLLRKQLEIGSAPIGGLAKREALFIPKSSNPGPGHYDYFSKGRKRELLGRERPRTTSTAPFTTTSKRFQTKVDYLIGPGDYSLGSSLEKESFGRNASFGITADRFSRRNRTNLAYTGAPGPGSYDLPRSNKVRVPAVSFASNSKRFDKWGKSHAPPPGTYDTNVSWERFKAQKGGTGNFKSKTTRFVPNTAAKNPGPSDYAPPVNGKPEKRVMRNAPPSFGSGSLRFEPNKAAQLPGPGAYRVDNHLSMSPKRSYNVTIS